MTSVVIQPSPGETLLLEHMLHNPMGRDTVFEVKVSHIDELSAVHNMQEYRQLQQAVGPATQTSATALSRGVAAAGQIPTMSALARAVNNNASTQQFVSKGRIFLAANERISIPMRYRLSAVDSDVVEQDRQQHTVMVEFMPLELGYPVNTLELQVLKLWPKFHNNSSHCMQACKVNARSCCVCAGILLSSVLLLLRPRLENIA